MKRSREEFLVCESLQAAGVVLNPQIKEAVADGLKRIRQEKYDAHIARKQHEAPAKVDG